LAVLFNQFNKMHEQAVHSEKKDHADITNAWESKNKVQLVRKVHKCQCYARLKLGRQEKVRCQMLNA